MPLLDDPWLAYDGSGSAPAVRAAAPVGVYRYDGAAGFLPLPNVECLWVELREGSDVGSAGFRYNFASGIPGAPVAVEEALGTGSGGPYIIEAGDRLAVRAGRPDGFVEVLFDGIAVGFGMSLDPDGEEAPIGAVGVAWTCWDKPIDCALYRDSDNPARISDRQTDLVAHFNPGGLPNCTPDGYMSGSSSGSGDSRYPVFLDPLVVRKPDIRTAWTLNKAARYLCFRSNPDEAFVRNPDGADLDALLVAPGTGGPIAVPDTPITGKDWPGTLERLVRECGFGMAFDLRTDPSGLPATSLRLFGRQAGPVKSLYFGARGSRFDPTTFNFNVGHLSRDVGEVVNQVVVEGGLKRYEVSLILMPGFAMGAADGSQPNLANYNKEVAANSDAYRLFVFDETGEGHYAFGSPVKLSSIPSLDGLFGANKYVKRRRKPIGTLISLDASGKPRKASLSVAKGYGGPAPGTWDGSGQWQVITSTTWQLLPDRLGIRITDKNPNSWHVGESRAPGDPYRDGEIKVVESLATSGAANFHFRLTVVVEADQVLRATATPTSNTPIPRAITRTVDARDRYRKDIIEYKSEFNTGGPAPGRIIPRDDTPYAAAEAAAIQAGTEAGLLAGGVVIPRLTTYYRVGDRIGSIEGRGLGLRTDGGSGTPAYPVVVGVRHEFGPESQTTTLELSDAGSDRRRYYRRLRRPSRAASPGRGGPGRAELGGGGAAGGGLSTGPSMPPGRYAPVGIPEGQRGYEGG